ncbi:hypothetical protein LTR66_010278 [Elasticomyces elasticus]|nr:hypothetical protein LTR66_010278 [Elasticomyces elasticus]
MAYDHHPYNHNGCCPSFFVEGEEDGFFARAAMQRERDRHVAKIHQGALAEELSRQTAEEYQDDILDHMEHVETEIQWFMRPYLLDFLLEAHHAFKLLPETIFLAINLLDRYCSRRVVYKRHYQLVGCASLLIAAKYGDRKERVPAVRELRSMCCLLYDDDMFTQMEWHVLQTLDWVIGHPTVTSFLQIALTETAFDPEVEHMATYISEIAMFRKDFVSVRPSVMARSALALARCILARPQPIQSDWAAQYDPHVALNLSNILNQPSQVLYRKYSSAHLYSVSATIEGFLAQQAQIARLNAQPLVTAEFPPLDVQQASASQYLNPQTPQKVQYPVAPMGVLTPPITPDKDFSGNTGYGVSHGMPPRLNATPTPPPSAEHQRYYSDQQYGQSRRYLQ